jgi:tyrosine-protein kinase Etk/Wzc
MVSFSLMTGLARRRWLLMLFVIGISLSIAVAYLMLTPSTYESGASLLVENKEYDIPDVTKRISPNSMTDVTTQLEVLKSQGLAEQVARDAALRAKVTAYDTPALPLPRAVRDHILPNIPRPMARSELFSAIAVADSSDTTTVYLDRQPDGLYRASMTRGQLVASGIQVGKPAAYGPLKFTLAASAAEIPRIKVEVQSMADAILDLREDARLSRADRDVDVLWIRYRSSDPVLAAMVPDLWARHYLSMRVSDAKSKVQVAVGFLRGQADTIQGQLMAAEEALRDYRQRAGIVNLEAEATSQVQQGAEVDTKRMMLEAERTALRRLVNDADNSNKQSSAPSPYRRLAGFPTLLGNAVVTEQLHNLAQLEDQRAELLERRTAQDPEVQSLSRRITDVDAQLRGLTNTYLDGLNNQLSSLEGSIKVREGRLSRIPSKSMDEERLARKPRVLSDVYAMVQTRLQEARIAENAADPGVRMVDQAEIPTEPVWPRPGLILLVALAVGVLGGGTMAWLREGMDSSVHSRADVIRAAGVPLLGLIPRIRMLRSRRAPPRVLAPGSSNGFGSRARRREQSNRAILLGGKDPSGAAMEAYAWLETSLALVRPNDVPRTVAFTSPLSREGKTINAANLALSSARRGKRVMLIDADLRRGMIHHLFGISQDRGLAEVLAGRVSLEQAVRCLPLGEGTEVHILPCGMTDVHPATALRPDALRDLLTRLEPHYDLILIDSPPVNLVSDPLVVANMVDGVVLVARAGQTESDALAEAANHLREAGAPVLGVLLNDIDLKRDSSYDEAYRYLDEAGEYATHGSVPA